MRRLCTSISIILSVLFLLSISSAQQTSTTAVPNLIRYSGTLKDAQGAPFSSATVGVTFTIYKQQDGGAAVWLEHKTLPPTATGSTASYWAALPQRACLAICSHSRRSAGWGCRCRDKPSSRGCCS